MRRGGKFSFKAAVKLETKNTQVLQNKMESAPKLFGNHAVFDDPDAEHPALSNHSKNKKIF